MSRTSLAMGLLTVLGIASLGTAAYLASQGRGGPSPGVVVEYESTVISTVDVTDRVLGTEMPRQPTMPPVTATTAPLRLSILVQDGESTKSFQTAARTVNELLAEAGIILGENDRLHPTLETALVDNMRVAITRAIPLTVQIGGQTVAIFSTARTPAEVLANAGIPLGELDIVNPKSDTILGSGDTIEVVQVHEETIVVDEEVPFQTLYQPTDELELDTKAVISTGQPGIKRRSTRIRYENGVEVSRVDEGQWMELEPVNQVIGYGTRIATKMVDTPEGPREYWRVVNMRVTAYTAASSGKPADHPSYGITASGLPAGTGIVAVDPNVVPFRSEVYVPGYGVAFAGDTGGGVKGRWIDLGYDEDELQTWNGYVDVYYLTPVPAEINYLIPEVLP